jgi:ABC-type multidrug transport system ATPase subunit
VCFTIPSTPSIPPLSPSNLSGYVQQQDVFIGAVTVREALRFSADLRLPKATTPSQRTAIVDETLRVLQLDRVAGSLIGDEEVRLREIDQAAQRLRARNVPRTA